MKRTMHQVFTVRPLFKGKDDSNVLYDSLLLGITILKLLCVLPITKSAHGSVTKIFSTIFGLYTVFFYAIMSIFFGLCLYEKIVQLLISPNMTYEDCLVHGAATFFLFFHWIPLCSWLEVNDVANYFNEWQSCQDYFKKVTGEKLCLNFKKEQIFMIIGMVLLMIVILVAMYIEVVPIVRRNNMPHTFLPLSFITGGYYSCLIVGYLSLWVFLNRSVRQLSQLALKAFKSIKKKEYQKIRQFCCLWARIRSLTNNIGINFSLSYIFMMMAVFLLSVAAAYITVSSFMSKNYFIAIFIFCVFTMIASCFVIIAEVAHRTAHEISKEWKSALSVMMENETNEELFRNELKSFYDFCNNNPVTIDLGGYTPLNRVFNLGLGGAFVTYIILFLQMQPLDFAKPK